MSIDRFWILIARKLSGEASTEEIRELEELLRTHCDLHFSVEIITNLWNQQAQKDQATLESSYTEHTERMKALGISLHPEMASEEIGSNYLLQGSRSKSVRRKMVAVASVVGLIIAGGFFYSRESKTIPAPKQEAKLEVSTKYGSRTDIQLPDGSKVWLNSGSTLTYDKQFGKHIREVVLTGEAFFDVVKNPEKPFIIHTTSMDIKVLGTRFNVKSYSGDKLSEASLIQGSIEVFLKKRSSQKILLKPNEKIVVMNDQVVDEGSATLVKNRTPDPIIAVQKLNYDSEDSTVIETSWVDHKLIFKNESFEDLAIKMERWFGTHVQFEDPVLKQERLTGSFTTETIEEALNALQISTAFTYLKRYNTIIITK